MNLLEEAIELEKKSIAEIVEGNANSEGFYIAFDEICSKLLKDQLHRRDTEIDIEVMKVLVRIPDPEAVCLEYYDRLDFIKEYPDSDFYIHQNSLIFSILLKIIATPLNIITTETDTDREFDIEEFKIHYEFLGKSQERRDLANFFRNQEQTEYEFAVNYLRSFIKIEQ